MSSLSRAEFLRLIALGVPAWAVGRALPAFAQTAAERKRRISDLIQTYDGQGIHRTATIVDNASADWLRQLAAVAGGDAHLNAFQLRQVDIRAAYIEADGRRIEGVPLFDGGFTGDTVERLNVYASGAPHDLQLTFTNTAAGAWDWTATCATAAVTAGNGTVTFNSNGSLATFAYPGGGTDLTITPTAGGAAFNVTVNAGTLNDIDGLAGFANPSNAVVSNQDGYPAGDLENISVDNNGVITGFFTNGVSQALAQIALAKFNNPSGLLRQGDNMYAESANSGLAVLGFAGSSNSSTITPGALENSNVDLSQEFTNMIVTQRGFQANARVISTADEMLNELVNLRR